MNKWLFTLRDGSSIEASFTDQEIRDFEIKYPEVKWIWKC